MRVSMLLIAGALCVPATAQSSDNGEDKIVCKRTDDGATGSNLRKWKKICRTAADWKAQEDETQRNIRAAKDKGLMSPETLEKGLAPPEL